MKEAILIKDVSKNFMGTAKVYELNPPMENKIKHVVVSTVVAPYSGVETYIFPSTKTGKVKDWGELEGSMRGTSSHSEVLGNAGYSIKNN